MQQDRAHTDRKRPYLAGRQVQEAIYSGHEHPNDEGDRDVFGRRDDTASRESFRHIAAHTRVDWRCGIGRVRKQPYHCGRPFGRAEAKMEYAAEGARDSLRWIADSFICARYLTFHAHANLRRELALERILVSEVIVKGAPGDVRTLYDFVDAQGIQTSPGEQSLSRVQ